MTTDPIERVILERLDETGEFWERVASSQHPGQRHLVCASFVGHVWGRVDWLAGEQVCSVCGRHRHVRVTYEEYDTP